MKEIRVKFKLDEMSARNITMLAYIIGCKEMSTEYLQLMAHIKKSPFLTEVYKEMCNHIKNFNK